MEIKNMLAQMTLEEKVGQLFMLAFAGSQIDHAREMLVGHLVGACYISNDNAETPAEAHQLSMNLQELAASTRNRIPLMLGVDQEGSWGVMVPFSSTGPGNLALGAANDPNITRKIYYNIGRELKAVGYNTLLAPCIDVNSNSENVILGARSFGEFPGLVVEQGKAAIEGANAAGVITTAKHYPGHGDTRQDSHRMLPVVDRPLEVLEQIDLLPYKEAIKAGVDVVMTAHILYPKIDPVYPATLSRIFLQDILRDKLGFGGMVLSDSMNMLAIRKNYSPVDAAILAILAGVDMIMLAEEHYDHTGKYLVKQRATVEGVLNAASSGQIPMSRLDDAVLHVLALKHKAGLFETSKSKVGLEIAGSTENRQVELVAASRAITLVRDQANLAKKPLLPAKTAIVRTTPRSAYEILTKTRGIGPNQAQPVFDTFENELRNNWHNLKTFSYESISDRIDLAREFSIFDVVIAVTEDYPLPGVDFDKTGQHALVKKLIREVGGKLIVLGFCPAYELLDYFGLATYICAHSSRPCAGIAAAQKIAGNMEFEGTLPFDIN